MRNISFSFGVVLIALGIVALFFVPAAWFSTPKSDAPKVVVEIPAHTDAAGVAMILVDKGVLTTNYGYEVYARIDSSANKPKAGTYTIQPGMNYRKLARTFFFGPEREEVEVKIIEGWTLADEEKVVKDLGASWKTPLASDWKADYSFLASIPKDATLEGYLFPDTYRVWKDQLPESLIKKQLDAFATRASKISDEAKKQGRTLHEVVTLASIVEKEVATPEDRTIVAGVFWNRLQIGMPLQSDATVNYVTHAGRTRPTAKDLAVESAYNTYKNKGLPPGPISNPGADALDAALFPQRTEFKYFLTDKDGKTYFARTLDEHIANRRKAFGS